MPRNFSPNTTPACATHVAKGDPFEDGAQATILGDDGPPLESLERHGHRFAVKTHHFDRRGLATCGRRRDKCGQEQGRDVPHGFSRHCQNALNRESIRTESY